MFFVVFRFGSLGSLGPVRFVSLLSVSIVFGSFIVGVTSICFASALLV